MALRSAQQLSLLGEQAGDAVGAVKRDIDPLMPLFRGSAGAVAMFTKENLDKVSGHTHFFRMGQNS